MIKFFIVGALSFILVSANALAEPQYVCTDTFCFIPEKRALTDSVLDSLFPESLYLNKVLGVSHRELAPQSFFLPEGKGIILGVNAVSPGEAYYRTADYMTGAAYTRVSPQIQQIKVSSPSDFVRQLVLIYNSSGPISKMVIAAHGSPGSMSMGGRSFNLNWVNENMELLSNLPPDLFAPEAQIVLISCSTAQGWAFNSNSGQVAIANIFKHFVKQGGTIIASTRYVDPELRYIPEKYKSMTERALRSLLLVPIMAGTDTIQWILSDRKSKFQKIVSIRIEPEV